MVAESVGMSSFPPIVQSCRCNFHFNKQASVADPILQGAFSITQGIIGISVHTVIGSAPGNALVVSSVSLGVALLVVG